MIIFFLISCYDYVGSKSNVIQVAEVPIDVEYILNMNLNYSPNASKMA